MIAVLIGCGVLIALVALAFYIADRNGRLPSILTPSGRRAWSFMALLGAAFVFTIFAAISLYIVRGNNEYSLYLGLCAHAQLLLILGAFAAQFVKRTIKVGRDGIEISDGALQTGDHVELKKVDEG